MWARWKGEWRVWGWKSRAREQSLQSLICDQWTMKLMCGCICVTSRCRLFLPPSNLTSLCHLRSYLLNDPWADWSNLPISISAYLPPTCVSTAQCAMAFTMDLPSIHSESVAFCVAQRSLILLSSFFPPWSEYLVVGNCTPISANLLILFHLWLIELELRRA
jgi:hypothetical protein